MDAAPDTDSIADVPVAVLATGAVRTPWSEFWRKFRRQKVALAAGTFVVVLIVVEKVFNWPGLGRLLVDAVDMRDYPVIKALVLLFSLEFILINLVVDVLYGLINPAIRYR